MPTTTTKLHVFDSLKLFREDLQEVIDIFSKPGGAVTLSDGDKFYRSFDEMSVIKGAELSHLVLENDTVGIKLDLQKRDKGLALTTIQTTDEAELTFYRTREFLRNKPRSSVRWADLMIPFWMTGIMAFIVYVVVPENRNSRITLVTVYLFILAVISGVMLAYSGKIRTWASLFVTLKRRHEYPPFVKRNRDNLILVFISTIIGIAGTLFVQYLRK